MKDKPILLRDFSLKSKQVAKMLSKAEIDVVEIFTESDRRLPLLVGKRGCYQGTGEIISFIRSEKAG